MDQCPTLHEEKILEVEVGANNEMVSFQNSLSKTYGDKLQKLEELENFKKEALEVIKESYPCHDELCAIQPGDDLDICTCWVKKGPSSSQNTAKRKEK